MNIFHVLLQRNEEYRELRKFKQDQFRIWGSCTLIHQNEAYAFGGLQNPTSIALLYESLCGLFLTQFQLPRPGMAFHSCCNLDVSFYELGRVVCVPKPTETTSTSNTLGIYGVLCFLRMSECCVVLIQMEPLVSNLILIQVQVRLLLRHPMTTLTGKPRHTSDHGITAVDHGTLVLEGLIVSQKRVTC